jgi:hypothetical protein
MFPVECMRRQIRAGVTGLLQGLLKRLATKARQRRHIPPPLMALIVGQRQQQAIPMMQHLSGQLDGTRQTQLVGVQTARSDHVIT